MPHPDFASQTAGLFDRIQMHSLIAGLDVKIDGCNQLACLAPRFLRDWEMLPRTVAESQTRGVTLKSAHLNFRKGLNPFFKSGASVGQPTQTGSWVAEICCQQGP